jgi:thymidylate kinase
MEQKAAGYHKKVRAGFIELAELRDDIIVLDASADQQTVHKEIVRTIEKEFS